MHPAACPLIEVAGSAAAIYQTGGRTWNIQAQEITFEAKRKKLSLLICNGNAILINIGRLLIGKTGDAGVMRVIADDVSGPWPDYLRQNVSTACSIV